MSPRTVLEIVGAVLLIAALATAGVSVRGCVKAEVERDAVTASRDQLVSSSKRVCELRITAERKTAEAILGRSERDCEARLSGQRLSRDLATDEEQLIEAIDALLSRDQR